MSDIDKKFQIAIDQETDRLARLPPIELMSLKPEEKIIRVQGSKIPVFITIQDFSDQRNIGIVARRRFIVGGRNFANGLQVNLNMNRMSDEKLVDYYD